MQEEPPRCVIACITAHLSCIQQVSGSRCLIYTLHTESPAVKAHQRDALRQWVDVYLYGFSLLKFPLKPSCTMLPYASLAACHSEEECCYYHFGRSCLRYAIADSRSQNHEVPNVSSSVDMRLVALPLLFIAIVARSLG